MLDRVPDDGRHHVARDRGVNGPLYMRPMPGGGYVKVELVVSDRGAVARERLLGRVVIEPRAATSPREHPTPLVLEVVEGDDEDEIVSECFRIARDNAAIARRMLRRGAGVERAD